MLFYSLNAHAHYVRNQFMIVLIEVINFFFNITCSIAVDVCSWNMSEDIKIFALFCKFKHSLASKIVDLESILKRVIKVDWGCTVYDNIDLIFYSKSIFLWQSKFFNNQVSLYWNNKRNSELKKSFLTSMDFNQCVEAIWIQNLLYNSFLKVHSSFLSY